MEAEKKPARIAIASSDGKVVNKHFGHAEAFYIVDILDGEIIPVALRSVEPVCDGAEHAVSSTQAVLAVLEDCNIVLASMIGAGMQQFLRDNGKIPIAFPGLILDVLEELQTREDFKIYV